MTTKPESGQRYRYIGECRAYKGLAGTASSVVPMGRIWSLMLSNVRDWPELRLPATGIEVLSTEIAEVESAPELQPETAATPATTAFEGAESVLVADITAAAKEAGYLVCVVGQGIAKSGGSTVGFPDMSFRRKSWPVGMACLLEVKVSGGRLSSEQMTLHEAGWSRIAWSVSGAMAAITAFESTAFMRRVSL